MGWLELLKELLSSVASILKDIPVWAKTVICLLVFGIVGAAVVANLEQVVVYVIEVREHPEPSDGIRYVILQVESGLETNYVSSVNDFVRASIPLRTGLLSDIGREFRIIRRTTSAGQQAQNGKFRYSGRRPLQSGFIPLAVECRMDRTFSCETVPSPGNREAAPRSRGIVDVAEAANPPSATINVPTLETLKEVSPDAGYEEIRVSALRVAQGACARGMCQGQMFVKMQFNDVEFLFDGIAAEASRKNDLQVTKTGAINRGVAFGIENTLFRESGNRVRLSFYQRSESGYSIFQQNVAPTPRMVDAIEVAVDLFRNVNISITGKESVVSGKLQARPVRGRLGQSQELFVGAGTLEEVREKRRFVNETLAARIPVEGRRIAGFVRPPLREGSNWGLALGLVEPDSDRVRLLLSEDEAKSLLARLKALPDSQLKPLVRNEFFIQVVTSQVDDPRPSTPSRPGSTPR